MFRINTNRHKRLPRLCLAGFLGGLASQAVAAGPPALFTVKQAKAGRVAYLQSCASCHGVFLQGITGPKLVGQDFAKASDHYSLSVVFNNLWEGTPAGAPDSLSQSSYVDIMAYLLAVNGYPAGGKPLSFAGAEISTLPFFSRFP